MVVSGPPLPYQSWLHSILVRSILIKPIFVTHQKLKLVPMVLHATVEKLTTWKALLLLFRPHCPRKYPFSPKVASRKVQPINVLNDMTPTVLRQAKEELRRTRSRLTRTTISHILRNQSLHSLAQAQYCLKQLQCLTTRQRHILPSLWVLNMVLLMVHPPTSRFQLIRRMCLPQHIFTIQVLHRCRLINLLLPNHSNQSPSMVTQGTHQTPTAVIHRIQDTEPNTGIIRTILPHLHHHTGTPLINGRGILGIHHSPRQSGILHLHRCRQLLLLLSLNMEETVKFPVDKEKGEKLLNVQPMFCLCFKSCLIKVCRFHSSLILCCYLVFTALFSCYSLCNPCSELSFV